MTRNYICIVFNTYGTTETVPCLFRLSYYSTLFNKNTLSTKQFTFQLHDTQFGWRITLTWVVWSFLKDWYCFPLWLNCAWTLWPFETEWATWVLWLTLWSPLSNFFLSLMIRLINYCHNTVAVGFQPKRLFILDWRRLKMFYWHLVALVTFFINSVCYILNYI